MTQPVGAITKEEKEKIFLHLGTIVEALRSVSEAPLSVGYDEGAVMGESTPFYHVELKPSSDWRRKLSLSRYSPSFLALFEVPAGVRNISPIVVAFDPGTQDYQINKYLTIPARKTVISAISQFDSEASINEISFLDGFE